MWKQTLWTIGSVSGLVCKVGSRALINAVQCSWFDVNPIGKRLNLFINDRTVLRSASATCREDQDWTMVMGCQEKKWWEWKLKNRYRAGSANMLESIFMFMTRSWALLIKINWLRREWTNVLCFMLNKLWPCYIALFYVRAQMFLQISCSLVVEFQWDLCTMKAHKQAKKRIQKTYNKETGKFHGWSRFINYGWKWREVSPNYFKVQLNVPLDTTWKGCGFFLCCPKEVSFSLRELILYKIILNKEITHLQNHGGKIPGGGWVFISKWRYG